MKLCLAATSSAPYLRDILGEARFVLESFWYVKDWQLPYIRDWEFFVLDSGAFTYMTKNKKGGSLPDPHGFQERYIRFVRDNNIKYYFNLDLDTVIGVEKTEALRRELEKAVGRPCMPVFHKCMGLKMWHEMCEEYDYVAIGTIADYLSNKRIMGKLCEIAAKYGTKVHGLGYTAQDMLDYGFYSVDSSSWLSGGRYGTVYSFKNGKMCGRTAAPGKRTIYHQRVTRHNFQQWVLYQKHLDKFD